MIALAPPKSRKSTRISTHGLVREAPKPKDENHEPARLTALGPVSQRLVSRSAPQTAHPAANGLTGSLQLGHRLRSGIGEHDRLCRRSEKWNLRLGEQGDDARQHER